MLAWQGLYEAISLGLKIPLLYQVFDTDFVISLSLNFLISQVEL